ncbi:hypothetical protein EPD60_16110 [Flaviaesturariibacter flavus]|uniref:Uncharacterized protein n=1 Tax=Flaviaesturariibacter flavus TaxID=2502780 RepID=A0A4R1B3L5_9BACT|nr:hypothetical protein [Flaviaesturariibacter flavus]TCJ12080.1 hypothetical protein EPD60_16110 [Flaviaesturariibacter flavus]
MANNNNRGNNPGRENEGSKPSTKSRTQGAPKTTQTGGQSGGGTHRRGFNEEPHQGKRTPSDDRK